MGNGFAVNSGRSHLCAAFTQDIMTLVIDLIRKFSCFFSIHVCSSTLVALATGCLSLIAYQHSQQTYASIDVSDSELGEGEIQAIEREKAEDQILASRLSTLAAANRPIFAFPSRFQGKLIRVFYATTRLPTGSSLFSEYYGPDRANSEGQAPLRYGTVDVNIPSSHARGNLEQPFHIFTFSLKEQADKHFMLVGLDEQALTDFTEQLRHSVRSHHKKAFVFIHGYYNSFADAARRTAQIANDLKVDMAPIMFSWPSQNRFAGYFDDYEAQRAAVLYLRDFLLRILLDTGVEQLHLIAHSMGSDLLTQAVLALPKDKLPQQPFPLGEVVLAAPDVDKDVFTAAMTTIKAISSGVTTYVCSRDIALKASHMFRRTSYRAGDSDPQPLIMPEMDTIDVSNAASDWLSHSYVTNNTSVLVDIFQLLSGKRPSDRFWINESFTSEGKRYWIFSPQ
jgi:esterase/lipase superfamily enzyme